MALLLSDPKLAARIPVFGSKVNPSIGELAAIDRQRDDI